MKRVPLLPEFRKKKALSNRLLSRSVLHGCKAGGFSCGCGFPCEENSPACLEGCANSFQDVQQAGLLEVHQALSEVLYFWDFPRGINGEPLLA
jgi:hypothetical protein